MRALPTDSLECLGEIALGNTAFPLAAGAGDGSAVRLVPVVVGVLAAGAGAADAVGPHCALRKSFHFAPLSVPAAFAALYLALHSCMERA